MHLDGRRVQVARGDCRGQPPFRNTVWSTTPRKTCTSSSSKPVPVRRSSVGNGTAAVELVECGSTPVKLVRQPAGQHGVRVQRVEPVGVEVAEHVPDPVRADEDDLRDRWHGDALDAEMDDLGLLPDDHRLGPAAQDPQQPLPSSLVRSRTWTRSATRRPCPPPTRRTRSLPQQG